VLKGKTGLFEKGLSNSGTSNSFLQLAVCPLATVFLRQEINLSLSKGNAYHRQSPILKKGLQVLL